MFGNILLGGFSHAFKGSFPASPVHKIPEWPLLTGRTPKARWCIPQPELWPSSVSSTTLKDPIWLLWSVRPKQQPSIKATPCPPPWPSALCLAQDGARRLLPHTVNLSAESSHGFWILYISNPLFVPSTQKSSCSPEKLIGVSIAFYKNEHVRLGGLFCGWFSLIPCPTAVLMTPRPSCSWVWDGHLRLAWFHWLLSLSFLLSVLPDAMKYTSEFPADTWEKSLFRATQ